MARTESIKVGSCTILGVIVVVFLTRQFMKATVFRKVAIDDLFVLVATVSSLVLLQQSQLNPADTCDRSLPYNLCSCF